MVFSDSRHWACYHNMCLLPPAQANLRHVVIPSGTFRNVSRLFEDDASTVFVLTGDLNKLNNDQLQTQLGLDQIVNNPTHNNNILDVFITNRPDLCDVQVGQSFIKTEHKALIVNSRIDCNAAKQRTLRRRVQVLNYNPVAANLFLQTLARYNWNCICAAIDCKTGTIDSIYNDFVQVVKWHVNITISIRTVAMGDRDPAYITPRIKLLLRKRNRLRRAGKVEQADGIAVKINKIIQRSRSTTLSGAKDSDTRQLWALLRRATGVQISRHSLIAILTK